MKQILATLLLIFGIGGVVVLSPSVVTAAPEDELCRGAGGTPTRGGGCNMPGRGPTVQQTIQNVVNVLTFLIGAIAVIMIVIGGLRYVLSGGDQTQVSNAKNTIIYACVGLVVTLMAYAIVGFVLRYFS